MQKHHSCWLLAAAAILVLGACQASKGRPLSNERADALQMVCIRDQGRKQLPTMPKQLAVSLQKHGIASQVFTGRNAPAHCQNVLTYIAYPASKTQPDTIGKAKLMLLQNGKRTSVIKYHQRGEEELHYSARPNLQAQTDRMVNTLLKNRR